MEKHQGYIVERIIDRQKEALCYEGPVTVCTSCACLYPPLSLHHAEVIEIRPACRRHEGYAHCAENRCDRIVLTLLITLCDCCGRRAQGTAEIELETCVRVRYGNIRRGAQIDLRKACWRCENTFDICAHICLYTVVTCSEMCVPKRECSPFCPELPLYPHLKCENNPNRHGKSNRMERKFQKKLEAACKMR